MSPTSGAPAGAEGKVDLVLEVIVACVWVTTVAGVVLTLAAVPRDVPPRLVWVVFGVAEAAVLVGIVADIVLLAGGWQTPDLATHIGYLVSLPFIAPAGIALTYKKIDRWGRLIIGVATLIAAIMVVRQLQTLGVAYGYLNLRPVHG